MATTTPNFGWAVPTSSDLVKNGATAIETLGDSIDASMVDLRGGTVGQTLVKASATEMDFAWSSTPSASNPILNSAYQVWQRGTSFTATNNAYTADRWQVYTGASTVSTVSRVATGDTTNLPNIQYALRYQRNSGQTGTALQFVTQSFESVNSIPYAGKSVTISFYARAGSNYSSASNVLTCNLKSGTGTDQNLITGFTSATNVIDQNATLTTTWQRFTYTGTVTSAATQLGVQFYFTPSGTAGANDYFEVTGIQLDIGSVALPFRTYAGTIQGELAACQRYYQKSYDQATAPATASQASGMVFAPWAANVNNGSPFTWTKLHQTMRTTPTLTIYSYGGTAAKVSDNNNTDLAANSGTVTRSGESGFGLYNNSGGTINTGNNGFLFHWTGSAEL